MQPTLAPGLLVAVPQLTDPNFRHSVVLLLEQNETGALGVIVNHDSPLRLEELCRDHHITYSGDPEKRVRRGGPVSPEQGLVLYGEEHRDPEGRAVFDGLHVSASRGTLSRLCSLPRGRFHCYSGYAGWGPGQLEREITEGSWVIAPVDPALVLDVPPDAIWEQVLRANGIDPTLLVPGSAEEA
ncbi:MAG TPA: YqgE/AlgH family protein [Candidatus Polarisedimenticolaceae bacterium]|nr:YqgE/AlgH family protein [Candidatus Polarisedimenticolaceae bacterium]